MTSAGTDCAARPRDPAARVYRGPNLWSYEPAIHLVVDLGSLEDYPTNTIPGFVDGLVEALPGIVRHSCSRGHRGGFLERLKEGTWLGHVAEHTALQLQQEAGHDIRRGQDPRHRRPRAVQRHLRVRRRAGRPGAGTLAVRLVNHLVQADPEFDFDAELERFLLQAQRTAFGPSTQAILDEAVSRDIPWLRLNEHSLVQLGQGVHQQRIRATMTSKTSALAVDIAGDKELTTRLLAAAGLPVPRSESVRTADQAVRVAEPDRLPGRRQAAGRQPRPRAWCSTSRTTTTSASAFPTAKEESRRGWVVVESFITGKDYRVLVIGGRMVALAERVPAHVVGDGVAHGARAGRRDQRRPASRRRPREGAHPHQGRRRRGRAGRASRASGWTTSRPRARWSSSR